MFQRIKMLSYVCDHEIELADGSVKTCGKARMVKGSNLQEMKKEGWAIGSDKRCYCPEHAPFHRHVGRAGKPRKFVRIKMEGIDAGR